MSRWQRELASFWITLGILCLTVGNVARADARGSIGLGLIPYSTSPGAYPQAFKGTGIMAGAVVYPFGFSGFSADYINSGSAAVGILSYRLFVVGEPQSLSQNIDELPVDREKRPLILNQRHWGLFIEGGIALYKVTSLVYAAGQSTVTSGGAAAVAVGVEYPVAGRFSAQGKLGAINAIVNQFGTIYGELGLSLAFSI